MEINFNSEWFQTGYYVYILKINHNSKGIFYYVGQTGDRNHKSARSPFYRLMGHYNTYNYKYEGTDAQLVKGLIDNRLIETKSEKTVRNCVEEAISNKTITVIAYYFKIADFGEIEHKDCVKKVEDIELYLINKLYRKNNRLFNNNNKIGSLKKTTNDADNIKKAEEILEKIMIEKGSKSAIKQLIFSNNLISNINNLTDSEKAVISDYDKMIPDANNKDKEAELKDFLKYNFSEGLGDNIRQWWLNNGNGNTPKWDFISTCTIDGKKGILLVEAKAHFGELKSNPKILKNNASKNSKRNHKQIGEAIQQASDNINKVIKNGSVSISLDECYQLSNRVAHAWWLASHGIPTVLMYLGFLKCNDMNNGKNKLFETDQDWQECFKEHAKKIGVDNILNKWVDCGKSKFITICKSL